MRAEALIVFASLAACVGRGGAEPDPRWETFRHRQKLVLNPPGVTETLLDVPLLFHVELDVYERTPLVRDALQFRDADGSTLLDFEIESWSADAATFWVRVPELVPGGGDYVWMVFGHDTLIEPQGGLEVWREGFVGVWHMTRAGAAMNDSSPNARPGVIEGVPVSGEHRAGDYLAFHGLDVVRITTSASEPLAITGAATLEAYARGDDPRTGWNGLIGRQFGAEEQDHYMLGSLGDKLAVCFESCVFGGVGSLTADTWVHVAAVRDVSGQLTLYKDGVELAAGPGGTARSDDNDTTIGAQENAGGPTVSESWSGEISEVRVSNRTRSADWLRVQALGLAAQVIELGPVETLR